METDWNLQRIHWIWPAQSYLKPLVDLPDSIFLKQNHKAKNGKRTKNKVRFYVEQYVLTNEFNGVSH